jgi:hypothetical protein
VAPRSAEVVTRKIRWYDNPDEERHPDAGDVLSYVDRRGDKPDWWHLVHHAWRVRGGGSEDLWLMVERLDFIDGVGIPEPVVNAALGGGLIDAERRPRRRSKNAP